MHAMFALNEDTVIHDPDGKIGCVLMTFNDLEGAGKIVLERGASGVYIHINGQCLALADLYYFSRDHHIYKTPKDPADFPQLVLYTSASEDEHLAAARWLGDTTEITVEDGAAQVSYPTRWSTQVTIRHPQTSV